MTQGSERNVYVRIEDVARVFLRHLADRFVDLLEIAAYVYSADSAVRRGRGWSDAHATEPWDRDFEFVIPVRDVAFWNRPDVQELLVRILAFSSNDCYRFTFPVLAQSQPGQLYLDLADNEDWPLQNARRVLMFSGGLDSVTGALETAVSGNGLVLVSHRSTPVVDSRLRVLYSQLKATVSVPTIHIPVWVNKQKGLDREHTQRTRAFLFAALGTVVAQSVGAGGVSFFENGVVSLNLPVADEVVRARASRTTHPHALALLTQFHSLVADRPLEIDNPYIFRTKQEVVSSLVHAGGARLIGHTCSCAHQGFFKSRTQWHCGTCSQCIDRRVAILAAGVEDQDPAGDYFSEVFVGPRQDGYERNMGVNYIRHAVELHGMGTAEMAERFNLELARAAMAFPRPSDAADRFIDLHKRHAETVYAVLQQQLQLHAADILLGGLERSCMLALVAGQVHREPLWRAYCNRLCALLEAALPRMVVSRRPDNEPQLQELCDGILVSQGHVLVREYPFMRWASVLTKPDWSNDPLALWIELKYIRRKQGINPITEAIAADITKYGDNGRRVLFVVYDPDHLVVDEAAFGAPVNGRPTMLLRIIR